MLKDNLIETIKEVAERKAEKYQNYHNSLEIEHIRNKKRVKDAKKKEVKIPEHWAEDKKYNPFYVLKDPIKIGNSIFNKLVNEEYEPFAPYIKQVDKKGSSKKREVYIFQIPDEAVSNYFYKRLLAKNKHRFSSFSYAYRDDRNVHYAIKDIALDIRGSSRTFVAEFDFKDFFGSIDHSFLLEQFDENGFLISDFERNIIMSFLVKMREEKGIPQGTSLSLFLANLVCWKLDKKLEQEGLSFARYADDTIIWSNDYNKICKSFEFIQEFSKEAGVNINYAKSDGISILAKKEMPSEFESKKNNVEFLGYSLSADKISIKGSSVNKIKSRISFILYKNLIQPLNKDKLVSIKIPSDGKDKDFLTAILQIRRYLYGNLNEHMLKNYLNGSFKRLNFKGLMSFYPLIDDEEQLLELDRWLLSTIMNTIKRRNTLLKKWNLDRSNQFPFNVDGDTLLHQCKVKKINNVKGLMEIPSFLRIYRAIQESVMTVGIEKTMHPQSNDYDYF